MLATRAEPVGIDLVVGDVDAVADGCFGALFSLPTSSGAVPDWRSAIDAVHAVGGIAVVATDLLACVLTTPPGQLGADIAIGSAQRFGVPMGFGGPHAAFIAAAGAAARALPGRIVGVSTDTEGRPALRLALQTREQHIRREKATSNICTAQVLLANIAGFYATWHGPEGLRRIAERVQRLTSIAAAAFAAAGIAVRNDTWFDTLQVRVNAADAHRRAAAAGIDLRHVDAATVGISFDETSTIATVEAVLAACGVSVPALHDDAADGLTDRRTDEVLTQSVFNRYHTEHEMLRYLRRLADRDLALDRTMIPLGSCTMKLNATVEMLPVTWPEFADVHPFAPDEETLGYRTMIHQLEQMLVAITGYDAVSLQPNAGSQGELAGLLAIRAYHRSNGEAERTVCLIPSSAHGTNAASAVMAGMHVVVVACDDAGQRRPRRPARQGRHGRADAGRRDGHLPVDARRVRGGHRRAVRRRPRARRPGVRRRGQPQRARRPRPARACSAPTSATSTCTRRSASPTAAAVPASARSRCAPTSRRSCPAIRSAASASRSDPCRRRRSGRRASCRSRGCTSRLMGGSGLRDATAAAVLNANYIATRLDPHFPVLYRGDAGASATSASSTCAASPRPRASRSTMSPSGSSTTASTPRR